MEGEGDNLDVLGRRVAEEKGVHQRVLQSKRAPSGSQMETAAKNCRSKGGNEVRPYRESKTGRLRLRAKQATKQVCRWWVAATRTGDCWVREKGAADCRQQSTSNPPNDGNILKLDQHRYTLKERRLGMKRGTLRVKNCGETHTGACPGGIINPKKLRKKIQQ